MWEQPRGVLYTLLVQVVHATLEVLFEGQRAHNLNVDAEHIGFKCELGELHA